MNAPSLFIEIGQNSFQVLDGSDGLDVPLERSSTGQLTPACRETITSSLRRFLETRPPRRGERAICAVGARGVSVRRLNLPSADPDELPQLLRLQIESLFPLPPHELAWGYRRLDHQKTGPNGLPPGQELMIFAMKREILDQYATLLSTCGLTPMFTLAALGRREVCFQRSGSYAVLDIGRTQSELISFEDSTVKIVRILPWGGDDLTRAIAHRLEISFDDAEKLKLDLGQKTKFDHQPEVGAALQAALGSLANLIRGHWIGPHLFVSGRTVSIPEFAPLLAESLAAGVACHPIEPPTGEGRSAAIRGLKKLCEREGVAPLLMIQTGTSSEAGASAAPPTPWRWAALAGLLAISCLSFRYAEPFAKKTALSQRLSQVKAERAKLPAVDQELSFLQHIETNQAPYLQILFAVADSVAPGTRFESLTITRRGDLSLRGPMANAQQATDFRNKLIDSGLFSTVVVDEITPAQDRRRVTVRITAQWKRKRIH